MNWTDPDQRISKYFTVEEALWLPTWSRMATEEDGLDDEIKSNLIDLFDHMDEVRAHLRKPINVHVAFRPVEYNELIGGAHNSMHTLGKAVDFDCGEECDFTRFKLSGMLHNFGMRMEKNPGKGWVHLDTKAVSNDIQRYFNP